jgi:hypothetical protein
MPPKPLPAPKPRKSVADHFRAEIDKAVTDGAKRRYMTLRLTLGDEADLRRDRKVALTDIRFADGVMHYLDVKIVAGGVAVSALEKPEPKRAKVVAPAEDAAVSA